MKKTLSLILILGIVFSLSVLSSAAEEKEKDGVKIRAKAVAGTEGVFDNGRSSKFYEDRDIPKGFFFSLLDIHVEKGNKYLNFNASRIRQADARYEVSFGDYGKYNLNFEWDKMPHRFSFDGKTLYNYDEDEHTGFYTLSDQIQADAQNAVGDGVINANAKMGIARTLISKFLTGAHPVGLELQRNKGTLDFSYNPSVPLSVDLNISREERKGARPLGASLGFSHVIELPEPVDFKTTNLDANLEYTKKWGTVRAGVYYSAFDNQVQTLIWDNPYRITDQTYSGAYSNGNGSVQGRMALAPSNTAMKFYLRGSFKLLNSTRLSGTVSYGTFRQNEALLPYTINTALAAIQTDAFNVPRETAKAKANIASTDFSLTSKIIKNVYLNAGVRYYNFDNRTEELSIPGYSRFDQVWEEVPSAVEPYKFAHTTVFGDVSFNWLENTSFKVGYSLDSIKRKLGEEDEGKSDEGTFKASVDSNLTDWLLFRVSYQMAKRDWSLEGEKDIYAPGFNFKRYHEADRDRNGVNVLIDLLLIKNLDVTGSFMLGRDKYPQSDYGLKKDDFTIYGLDLSYSFAPSASIYGFYSRELYEGDQASRQSGAVISTDPRNDWTATLKDTVDTLGGGLTYALIKNKLSLDLSLSSSKAEGKADLFSPPGGTPDTAKNFDRKLDATTLQSLKASLRYKLRADFSVVLGYWYEQYKLEDITRNDWRVDMLATGFAMYLGALEPGFDYHVAYLKFIWSW
jgi:MtrB/PioB family decaheme-associated outer membrane protein